jgi:hypothetical protein
MTEAPSHPYRTEIPNSVDDMDLSPYAFRLYAHIKRVAGDNGECWQSTITLSEACHMSTGAVTSAKKELLAAGLIQVKTKKEGRQYYHLITIVDIWHKNTEQFTRSPYERVVTNSPDEGVTRSPSERTRSPSETKKNPIKKNPLINMGGYEPPKNEPALTDDEKNFLHEIIVMYSKEFSNQYQCKKMLALRKKHTEETTLKAMEYYALIGVELGDAIRRADRALPTWRADEHTITLKPTNGKANGYQRPMSAQARAMADIAAYMAELEAKEKLNGNPY